jgi:hypothetical protein
LPFPQTATVRPSIQPQPCTPNWLYRQVTRIWNEAARDAKLGLKPLTVPSFRGPPKRVDWPLLSRSFRRDVDKYLEWASQSDPFEPERRPRRLAPQTLRLRRDQIHAAVSALIDTGMIVEGRVATYS